MLPDAVVNPVVQNAEFGESTIDFDWGEDEVKWKYGIPFRCPETQWHHTFPFTSSSLAPGKVGVSGELSGPVS